MFGNRLLYIRQLFVRNDTVCDFVYPSGIHVVARQQLTSKTLCWNQKYKLRPRTNPIRNRWQVRPSVDIVEIKTKNNTVNSPRSSFPSPHLSNRKVLANHSAPHLKVPRETHSKHPQRRKAMSRQRDPPHVNPAAQRPHIVRCSNCRVWNRWRPIIPVWDAAQGSICVLCEEATTSPPEPLFSFADMDDLFARKIAQVEAWLYTIDVMSREADILEYGMERRNTGVDSRVAMADTHGPQARGIPVSRESWQTLTHQQKREHAISDEERPLYELPSSLAAFYRTVVVVDKPALLLRLARLKDRSDGPLLNLWEQRHEQPSGVYTGVV